MTKVSSFSLMKIVIFIKYDGGRYIIYSRTTYLDINEPDLRWTKSVDDIVVNQGRWRYRCATLMPGVGYDSTVPLEGGILILTFMRFICVKCLYMSRVIVYHQLALGI